MTSSQKRQLCQCYNSNPTYSSRPPMFFDSRLPAVVLATFSLLLATPLAHGQASSADVANLTNGP